MPIYEYKCKSCGNEFEYFHKYNEEVDKCDECGSTNIKKKISGSISVIFRGSGFYDTDYKNKKE